MLRPVAVLVTATAAISCASRQSSQPSLRWVADVTSPGQATVEARPFDWNGASVERVLRVYARAGTDDSPGAAESTPAMLGTYDVKGRVVRFRPKFPLEPGVRYEAVLDVAALPGKSRMREGVLTATYAPPPRPPAAPTAVSRVYPTADTLPENLLKFYVHFSAPMSRGGVYRHVKLIDDDGRAVELPFLELDEELWDPGMTRLTLFIDPGRIKRGVRPLEDIGPALEEGRQYTLVIARDLPDATGRQLGEEFRKRFVVGPPDRGPPDPKKWGVTPPPASTRQPLTIRFPDPMDAALAERLIRVTASGGPVSGAVTLAEKERRWTFTPDEPWPAGRYEIVVQPTVEDLAGNNIGKPFEVDTESGAEGRPDLPAVRLPVEVR